MLKTMGQSIIRFIVNSIIEIKYLFISKNPLDVDDLVKQARKKTGLIDFGDESFLEPLHRNLEEAVEKKILHRKGTVIQREGKIKLLSNRLEINDYLKKHPKVKDEVIKEPIFIVGLPRTGSTMLHRLLACDPALRWLRGWESHGVVPPVDNKSRDRKIASVRAAVTLMDIMEPRLKPIHPVSVTGPEECLGLLANSFDTIVSNFFNTDMEFSRWTRNRDTTSSYEFYKTQLQILQYSSQYKGQWLLKSPMHTHGMEAIIKVFPDAKFIQMHRDPRDVIASICSLTQKFQELVAGPIDPIVCGKEQLELWPESLEKCAKARENIPSDRIVDIFYPELIADTIGTVRSAYNQIGLTLSPEAESAMRMRIANRSKNRKRHHYALSDYGLDRAKVEQAFASYLAEFGSRLNPNPSKASQKKAEEETAS
ncbi:sulfotransferase family protein [Pleionea sediminis]|uniref:sulfotransferase family protein n=1 Tax=Pleionea sediminis TaxID=2569479 RepID=UPI0013DE61B5|nr:sulfotransferase [Pleionea sediminis]